MMICRKMMQSYLKAEWFGPKALPFFQPRATPWGPNFQELNNSAQRPTKSQ
jgi:hypothetical protein